MREYAEMVKNTFNYSGRARRREYWVPTFINSAIQLVLFGIMLLGATLAGDNLFAATETSVGFSTEGSVVATILLIPYMLFSTFSFVTMLSLTIRRYHDAGFAGWVYAICLLGCCLCGIGAIANIVLCCLNSKEDNQWGENPKNNDKYENSHSILAVCIIYPIILLVTLGLGCFNALKGDELDWSLKESPISTEETTERRRKDRTEEVETEEPETEEPETEEPATEEVDTEEPYDDVHRLIMNLDEQCQIEIFPPTEFTVEEADEDFIYLSTDDIDVCYSVSYIEAGEAFDSLEEEYVSYAEVYEDSLLADESVSSDCIDVAGNDVYYMKAVVDEGYISYKYLMYVDLGAEYLLEIEIDSYGVEITDEQAFVLAEFSK